MPASAPTLGFVSFYFYPHHYLQFHLISFANSDQNGSSDKMGASHWEGKRCKWEFSIDGSRNLLCCTEGSESGGWRRAQMEADRGGDKVSCRVFSPEGSRLSKRWRAAAARANETLRERVLREREAVGEVGRHKCGRRRRRA